MAVSTHNPYAALPVDDQQVDPLAGKRVWTRAVFNEEVATDEIGLDAKKCLRQDTFMTTLDRDLQIIDWSTSGTAYFRNQRFQGKVLCVPIIILEETNTSGSHRMRHVRFSVVEGNATFNWDSWVQRNLLGGNTNDLKAEVHFFILEDDELMSRNLHEMSLVAQELTVAGKGLGKLEDNLLTHIEVEDLQTPLQQWLPFFQTTPTDPDAQEYDRSTDKHFPERYIEDPLAFSANCKLCHRIARERGLLQAGRREKARANYAAAQVVGAGDASGGLTAQPVVPPVNTTSSADTSMDPVSTTNIGSTSTHPINTTMNTGAVNDIEADERLARALLAEENGLRRRTSRGDFKGLS